MNKLIIIGASIAGILGTMDIITTDPLKYGAVALLVITALMTLNELNPPQKQRGYRETKPTMREKPKDIWGEFGDRTIEKNLIKGTTEPQEVETKEEVKPNEIKKEVETKEPTFKIEDTTNVQEQNKIQDPEEMQKA